MFSKERNFLEWNLNGFGDSPAILFENLDSTHSLMKAKAAAGEIAPGTLIVADMQTSGRGRHERSWASPAGLNLYFNILIPLDRIPLGKSPQITQVRYSATCNKGPTRRAAATKTSGKSP